MAGGMGFGYVRFPPMPCNGRNVAILYYSLVLPTNLILGVGITLTILVLWRVHIVSDKFDYYGKYNKILQIHVVIIIEWPHYKIVKTRIALLN